MNYSLIGSYWQRVQLTLIFVVRILVKLIIYTRIFHCKFCWNFISCALNSIKWFHVWMCCVCTLYINLLSFFHVRAYCCQHFSNIWCHVFVSFLFIGLRWSVLLGCKSDHKTRSCNFVKEYEQQCSTTIERPRLQFCQPAFEWSF